MSIHGETGYFLTGDVAQHLLRRFPVVVHAFHIVRTHLNDAEASGDGRLALASIREVRRLSLSLVHVPDVNVPLPVPILLLPLDHVLNPDGLAAAHQ